MNLVRRLIPFSLLLIFAGFLGFAFGRAFGDLEKLDPSDWMQFTGALLGSIITIAGAYAVFHLQTEVTDRRRLRTIVSLVTYIKIWGLRMQTEAAARRRLSDIVRGAIERVRTAEAVAQKLETEGPVVAGVARRLAHAPVVAELDRLARHRDAVQLGELRQAGRDLVALADECLYVLRRGL